MISPHKDDLHFEVPAVIEPHFDENAPLNFEQNA